MDSAEAIALIATQGYLTDTLDSAEVTAIIDAAYIQARQTPQDFAYGSLTDAPTNLSQFNNDTNYLDSTTVIGVIDASYIQSNQTTYDFLDSSEVIGLIDSAYINLRTDANIDSAALIALVDSAYVQARQAPGTDSSEVQNIITEFVDSAYVQLRQTPQDFAYSSLTGAPNVLDSAAVAEILPDGTFRGLRSYTFTADSGDTSFSGTDDNGNSLTYSSNSLVVYANGILLVPTTDYTATDGSTITLSIAADSADVITAHNIVAGGTDSALINQEILGLIDSAYVQARETAQDFAYSSLTGAPTTVSTFTNDANYLDSTTVTGVIDATYIQSNQTTYDFLDSAEAIALIATQGYLTDALDSAEVVGLIDSAYVQARQSNPDQTLNTTDSVTFAGMTISGDLHVTGTTTETNTVVYTIQDPLLHLADSNEFSDTVDIGFIGHYSDDGGSTKRHTGFFRDASNSQYYIFNGLVDAAFDSTLPTNIVNRSGTDFELADLNVGTINGQYAGFDSDVTAAGLATQSYVTTTVDSAYVQLRQTPQDFAYGSLTGVPTTVSTFTNDANYLDSTTVTGVIDASYIQSNQTTYDFLDSAEAIALIATQGYLTDALDSAEAISVITGSDLDMGTNKILYSNVYSAIGDLPSASSYHGMFAHVHATGAAYFAHAGSWIQLANNSDIPTVVSSLTNDAGYTTYDSTNTLGLIDSAYINARVDAVAGTDSAATIALIQATVDSAYVAAREADAGGGSGGTDSATVISLTQATVDSDYVLARIPDATLQGVNQFEFIADSGQTVFTGTDRDGNGLNYNSTDVLVFLNGTLMVPGNDFVTTNSSTITFTEGVDSGDFVNIFNFTAGRAVGGGVSEVNHFDFTADSGQTAFTGTDDAGSTLSFIGNDNIQVFINGILLKQSDYTTTNNNTVTLGIAADSADEVRIIAYDTYSQRVAIDDYNFTADSGQTVFTGTDDDNNTLTFAPGNLQVHLNGIMLRSGNDYSTTGSGTVTLVSGADSGDTLTVTAISGDSAGYQTIVTGLIDSAYIQARETAQDFAYSSLTGAPNVLDSTNVSSIVTSYGYSTFDSADVRTTRWSDNERLIMGDGSDLEIYHNGGNSFVRDLGAGNLVLDTNGVSIVLTHSGNAEKMAEFFKNGPVQLYHNNSKKAETTVNGFNAIGGLFIDSVEINAAYVQANQIKYSTADFVDSAYVATQITNLVDGAPTALDTLNELATALQNDSDALASLITVVDTKLNTAGVTTLVDSAYVQSRQTAQDFAYSSLTGAPTTVSTFTNDANYLDSTTVTGVIDASYIQSNQTTYDFLDSAEAIALIATQGYLTDAIDSARVTSMLAADSFSIGGTVIGDGKIEIFNGTGSTPSYIDLYCEVSNAHYTRIQSADHSSYSGNVTLTTPTSSGTIALTSDIPTVVSSLTNDAGYTTYADADVTSLIDSAYINARVDAVAGTDSAATIALIQATVDSAYVAAREADVGGGGGTDSATVLALIQATVDSAYVAARDPGGSGGVTFRNYEYTADSGQTIFTGADTLGNSLAYTPNQLQVYRNGILLIDSADYTATSSNTVTLTTASETGDNITVATFTATVGATVSAYDYFADSGQTSFSGVDIDGNTLSFTGSNVLVHVNGLLLTDSNDYTRVGGSTITFDAGLDSGDVVSIIAISDLASEGGTDSAATISLIENTVDSAYIAARSAAGTDSATVEDIIRSLVDSDYVFARQRSTTGLVFDAYSYTSDSAQTVFSGADNNNLTLHYNVGEIQVFRNGILLVDSDDYTASNGTSVILNSAAALNDNISIASFTSATNEIRMNEFEFTADSAQTIFIGIDDGGSTLSYNAGNILVHLNGILLSDSADYSAGNGTSITLNIGADSGDILHISSFSTPAETNLWREVTSTTYNITAGNKLIVDTSSSTVTVNLPTIASFGDEVKIIDGTGNAATNNITINRNGHKILASDSDFTIDVDRTAVDLVYYNTTNGWIISGNT